MFTLAVFIGIYSYALMGLGLVGRLYPQAIWIVTGAMLVLGWWTLEIRSWNLKLDARSWMLMGLIVAQAVVNLIGVLGPERGFDALWYHLPIPRIWLEAHRIFFMGGNLYYSAMPKLIDMLYVWGEVPAKLMHLAFGLLSAAVTYRIARKFVEEKWAMLAAVIFYSNLVVGWQSITAYIDLGRTFFEALAFYLLVDKKIYKSAVVLGLAMATKTLAIGSLGILGMLVWVTRTRSAAAAQHLVRYVLVAVLVAAPWYVFSWVNTGNPFYPIFSGYKPEWEWRFNLLRLADPINPIYVMILPFAIFSTGWNLVRPAGQTKFHPLLWYCLLSFGVWYLTPRTGGGEVSAAVFAGVECGDSDSD